MRVRIILAGVASAVFLAAGALWAAQDTAKQTVDGAKVVLVEVVNPYYPPLARQTRISGVVKLSVKVRRDGTVDSVEMISGHQLLGHAAVESAQKSRFECVRCTESVTQFTLTYNFEMPLDAKDVHPASHTADTVTISVAPIMIDHGGFMPDTKVRSIKCLYLWKCSESRTIHSIP